MVDSCMYLLRTQLVLLCGLLLVIAPTIVDARRDQINGFDLSNPLVPRKLIKRGGPPRDGIPSINNPRFVSAEDADHLVDTDRVLGLSLNGVAKAYPIKILNYHEIVNDYFDDRAVAVTFCPLCGSGIAFDAEVDGLRLEFGVSGLLYNSDVLMYDRQTESLWSQIMGQAVTGDARGTTLAAVPVRHTTWADWLRRHPDSVVLEEPRFIRRDYAVDPYLGYAQSKRLWAPVAYRDKRYQTKEVVIGAVINGQPHAWPFAELPDDRSRVETPIGGTSVTLEYDLATQSARVVNAEDAEIPSFTAFWFAWVAFHPDTGVYQQK